MRLAAALLIGALATACSTASADTGTPTAAPANPAALSIPDVPLLASEGGVLRPIDNGGRVAMQRGYATVRMTPSPQSMDPRLEIALFDSDGKAQTADVWVVTEMVDMDMGSEEVHARVDNGTYTMRLSFGMPGAWRLKVHVVRAGNDEGFTIVVPWVGL